MVFVSIFSLVLERPLSKQEVKMAMWDSDSFKNPCNDGINFGFHK
jgi:hypothetical protein